MQDCPKGHRDDCPAARGELTRRSDDNEATIQRRLEVYRREIAPVLGFYDDRVSNRLGLTNNKAIYCIVMGALFLSVSHGRTNYPHFYAQGILCTFKVKKGVKDAPALEAMMTTERT